MRSAGISERAQRVAELTRQGLSARQIAEILRVTTRTVHRDRRAAGCAQARPRRLTAEQLELMARLVEDGCSYLEIARTVGCADVSVVRHFPGRPWTGRQIAEFRAARRKFSEVAP